MKTHFGYKNVESSDKENLVRDVFDSVASKYDVMNDLMSFGIHRLWKSFALKQSCTKLGDKVLDVAGGTGDLAIGFTKRVGETGEVILSDINNAMLQEGRNRLINSGVCNVPLVQANAENMPFCDNYFDCVSVGFGLRNVTDKQQALNSMYKIIKPGGRLLILEFSHPIVPGFDKLYDAYSFHVIPKIGKLVTHDEDSYRYLAESIRKHPDQDKLKQMILDAGFKKCTYNNLTGGIVAIHLGYK
ncbi:MAG: bifunctional demethylmenaquinone methyltransferase/2-methoxy-6-polyprenyl-1,4-benzoquinol methylase UbiE [Gammaproteobacteria bacterium]|nr:MAG: bifunctional demethylmenaquinone methyltransferase/2-methoxy-6-polyprenyl-1,4-benzoquinol methylase UbiE [Gammaproteobacteria bacterium]